MRGKILEIIPNLIVYFNVLFINPLHSILFLLLLYSGSYGAVVKMVHCIAYNVKQKFSSMCRMLIHQGKEKMKKRS